jgi:predicted transcriptional regulator
MLIKDMYKIEYDIAYKKNINIISEQAKNNDPLLIKRLEKLNQTKYKENTVEELLEETKRSTLFAKLIAIDPKKQNFFEGIAFRELKKYLKKLKNSTYEGKKVYIQENGNITYNKNEKYKTSKSIDFYGKKNGICYCILHKYTNESGGSQDNTKIEVINFLEAASKNKKNNVIFVTILDGDYYKKHFLELKKYEKSNIIVSDIDSFIKYIKNKHNINVE